MKKIIIGVLIGALITGGIILILNLSEQQTAEQASGGAGDGERTVEGDNELMEEQNHAESLIQTTYSEGEYDLEEPLVVDDPYGVAPLTALAIFDTDESQEITVTVEGESEEQNISKKIEGFNNEHKIPILGLYPDQENTVVLEGETEDGEIIESNISINTDPLPDDFLENEVIEAQQEKMEKGLTFIIPSGGYAYGIDSMGDVRWYSSLPNSHVFQRLENDKLVFLTQKVEQSNQYNLILEMDMLGQVSFGSYIDVTNFDSWGVVHHDVIELPNDNFLATDHDGSGYIEDDMVEIDRQSGEMVDELNMRDIFPEQVYEDYDGASAEEGDWFHQNAVWYDDTGDDILVSSRHQDAIIDMSYPEGEIDWILAAHEGWPEELEDKLLEPQGEDFKFPGGPHAIMTLPDQDEQENTMDVLLFDNNIAVIRGDEETSEEYSRAVQYRINTEEMTVEEVWSYGEERGKDFFSNIVGDADYLQETGNRLITSGHAFEDGDELHSRILETTDDQEAEVVYELKVTGFKEGESRQVYRSERMPLYPENWEIEWSE
ncbi:aryl-sulfate sulfotransferase [Halobacillus sp. A1]|uniref:aryl-sulfate sulfotransferase n=1 Tax=Halobacillus sp. A1 TaxID=2880262 RepID=UPI0020A6C60B|nr:aryl-sulfate sulfotransferase [Halobacillus sp. A1]MCP3032079.1 aryl-sulfate sulfotransferase [Halobacillus sp. A1]